MDFSENLSQMHKYEPQSAHFNKRKYSLHCTVEHVDHQKYPHLKSPYLNHYYLSDDMKPDSAFTSAVIQHLFHDCELPYIIQIKSDSCLTQYKCGLAFGEYLKLAKKIDQTIKYYGPSGHGKGLVDAMSASGGKTPLRNAIVTYHFKYKSSQDICNMLQAKFKGDMQKKYWFLDLEEILLIRQYSSAIPIEGSRSFHMMCFNTL